jgi:hypothetical protein
MSSHGARARAHGEGRPLFIVGLPRSGTTLLRNLLHGHSEIAMTSYESHFLPSLLAQQAESPADADVRTVDRLLARFKSGLLYQKDRERGKFLPSDEELRVAFAAGSWPAVICGLFDLYCDKPMAQAAIWGDKTPAYLDHLDLIRGALPDARFIHIIRDPRDQALSERAIWGKSLRRSAETWRRRIANARASRPAMEGRYLETTYESLVCDPEQELRRLSAWLEVDYQETMLESAANSDELGQMVGATSVSADAIGGRRRDLSLREEAAIASLAGEIGSQLAYNLPAVSHSRLGKMELPVLAAHDRLALLGYFVRTKGLTTGLKFFVGSFLDSRHG